MYDLPGLFDITLHNVNIDRSAVGGIAFDILARVNLTLTGTNSFKSGSDCPGIENYATGLLTVTKQSTGTLTATGGTDGAGIGSSYFNLKKHGTVIINGGTVTAIGGTNGAGIGGADDHCTGAVIINGGTVHGDRRRLWCGHRQRRQWLHQ